MHILDKRKDLYSSLKSNVETYNDHGIFFNVKIKDVLLERLRKAFTLYIHKTLESWYGRTNFLADWRFDACDFDYLNVYENEIFSLPNISPNGIFLPKLENIQEYNNLQERLTDIIVDTQIVNHISYAQCITPRIVSGIPSIPMRSRPLATEKYHSDAWASQIGDCILSIPVGGDPSTTVELCEPINPSANFFSSLTNYDDAYKRSLFESLRFLDFAHFGAINIFDHSCVHRTLKQNGKLRISLEIGMALNHKYSLFDATKPFVYKSSRNTYLPQKDVYRLGKSLQISVSESMQDAESYQKNNFPRKRDNFQFIEL